MAMVRRSAVAESSAHAKLPHSIRHTATMQAARLPTNRFIRFLTLSESLHRLIAELAAQQTAGVIRHPAQPLLEGLLFFQCLVKLGHLLLRGGFECLGIQILRVCHGRILLALLLLLIRLRLIALAAITLVTAVAFALFLLPLIR